MFKVKERTFGCYYYSITFLTFFFLNLLSYQFKKKFQKLCETNERLATVTFHFVHSTMVVVDKKRIYSVALWLKAVVSHFKWKGCVANANWFPISVLECQSVFLCQSENSFNSENVVQWDMGDTIIHFS